MKDRHVLITGGSGALGIEVTKLALERGARVVVPYIDEGEVAVLKRRIGGIPEALRLIEADLTQEVQVQAVFEAMKRVDSLIHLVGGFVMGPTHEFSLDAWREHHDLTLTTTFLCCKHALLRMKKSGYGRIVTVGSKAAVEPMPRMAAYASAKAGVVALTKVIAAETKGTRITANCVLPSVIDTPANREAMGDDDADKWVTPSSLAQTICHLAAERAGDIRGAAIPVYGSV